MLFLNSRCLCPPPCCVLCCLVNRFPFIGQPVEEESDSDSDDISVSSVSDSSDDEVSAVIPSVFRRVLYVQRLSYLTFVRDPSQPSFFLVLSV